MLTYSLPHATRVALVGRPGEGGILKGTVSESPSGSAQSTPAHAGVISFQH
jgi:hypothetical protein